MKNKPMLYALGAAVVGFVVVRQVMAAKGTPTTYKGNTYQSEAQAQAQKDVDALFATPTNQSPGIGAGFVATTTTGTKANGDTLRMY